MPIYAPVGENFFISIDTLMGDILFREKLNGHDVYFSKISKLWIKFTYAIACALYVYFYRTIWRTKILTLLAYRRIIGPWVCVVYCTAVDSSIIYAWSGTADAASLWISSPADRMTGACIHVGFKVIVL